MRSPSDAKWPLVSRDQRTRWKEAVELATRRPQAKRSQNRRVLMQTWPLQPAEPSGDRQARQQKAAARSAPWSARRAPICRTGG